MTRSHRRLHLVMWLICGPLAVAVLVAAIVMKPRTPIQDPSPQGVIK